MKIIWEARDIRGGRRSKKPGVMGEGTIIGYEPGSANRWALISLDDGLVICRMQSQEQLATLLTEGGEVPVEVIEGDRP